VLASSSTTMMNKDEIAKLSELDSELAEVSNLFPTASHLNPLNNVVS